MVDRAEPSSERVAGPGGPRGARAGALLFLAAVAWPLGGCGRAESGSPPIVILVSIDTLRADRLSCYGHARTTSPFLDRLARTGVLFSQAYTTAPWTVPAHMSLLTGKLPALYRVPPSEVPEEGAQTTDYWWLDPAERTLAERFREEGYDTAGFVDSVWLVPELGMDQGFEAFDTGAAMLPEADPDGGVRTVCRKALDWIDGRDGDGPFFLFLHVFDVHGPYAPPEPFDRLFRGDARYRARAGERYEVEATTDRFGVISSHLVRQDLSDPENPTGFLDAQYDGGIAFVDRELEGFFAELGRRGLLRRTIVAITSDHGESLGEHEFFGHGILYDPVMLVPMILWAPGSLEGGCVDPRLVSTLDLAPTLLDLAGIPRADASFHGRSLVADPGSATGTGSRSLYLEGGIRKQFSIVDPDWKYVLRFPHVGENHPGWLEDLEGLDREVARIEELFDRARDPAEQAPVAEGRERWFRRLGARNSEVRARWEAFLEVREGSSGEGVPEAIHERLRELGYLDGG